MKRELTTEQALQKAQRWCASAERCSSEVHDRILSWGCDERTAATIIASLVEERYVDDSRYCRAFVRDRFRFSGWGRMKIREALLMKRLSGSCVEEALGEIDQKEYSAQLRKLIEQKARSVEAASDYERKGKIVRFAAGKGYEIEEIMKELRVES